jgi:rubrerythrin
MRGNMVDDSMVRLMHQNKKLEDRCENLTALLKDSEQQVTTLKEDIGNAIKSLNKESARADILSSRINRARPHIAKLLNVAAAISEDVFDVTVFQAGACWVCTNSLGDAAALGHSIRVFECPVCHMMNKVCDGCIVQWTEFGRKCMSTTCNHRFSH